MMHRPATRTPAGPLRRAVAATTVAAALAVLATESANAAALGDARPAPPPGERTGTLPDGATWLIEQPANWNGTLVLYSHGMVAPGEDNPAVDTPEPITGKFLLDNGYALAGSSYAGTGFAMQAALDDQAALVGIYRNQVAIPATTIAWGSSLGGAVTAGLLERHPELFDGGLSMCGVVAGGVGLMDSYLDTLFALKTLIAPDVSLIDLGNTLFDAIAALQSAIETAQATPEGRARIALAAAIGDFPGWAGADNPRPDPGDLATQQSAQFQHMMELAFFGLALCADVAEKSGGNPTTNVDVNYAKLLRRSNSHDEVVALYQQAGSNLQQDLTLLDGADRIQADPAARANLAQVSTFTGEIADPMLTLHTAGDQLAVVAQEQAYAATVRGAGHKRCCGRRSPNVRCTAPSPRPKSSPPSVLSPIGCGRAAGSTSPMRKTCRPGLSHSARI